MGKKKEAEEETSFRRGKALQGMSFSSPLWAPAVLLKSPEPQNLLIWGGVCIWFPGLPATPYGGLDLGFP